MSAPLTDWIRVKAIFDAAVVLEPEARPACVRGMCGSDDDLRQHVEALLESHERAGPFLERPAAALISSSPDELIGRTLATYRIVSRLGAGGMGEVYKAHDSKLERDVALKLLPHDVDTDRLRRFHAEARTVSSLNHPQIVVIHDFGDLDGRPFIITELVEGDTLRQRLERGPLPIGDTVAIATQIASALVAAHARGDRPSRHQAGKRDGAAGRLRKGARLRPGQARRAGRASDHRVNHGHESGSPARHASLHVAGTSGRQGGR
jgi:serine/threonine protein kinase